MNTLICLGLGVGMLWFTWWDHSRDETAINIYGFQVGFDREDYPVVYWLILAVQGMAGAAFILYGLLHIRS